MYSKPPRPLILDLISRHLWHQHLTSLTCWLADWLILNVSNKFKGTYCPSKQMGIVLVDCGDCGFKSPLPLLSSKNLLTSYSLKYRNFFEIPTLLSAKHLELGTTFAFVPTGCPLSYHWNRKSGKKWKKVRLIPDYPKSEPLLNSCSHRWRRTQFSNNKVKSVPHLT